MDSKIRRNILSKTIEAVVTIAASIIQLAVIARFFEATVVGLYQLTLAWLFFVTALSCNAGLRMIATRDLTNGNDSTQRKIFSTACVLQMLIAVPLCVVCLALFAVLPTFHTIVLPISIGTVCLLGGMVLQMSQALLVSKEEIGRVVVASIAGHVVATLMIVVVALFGLSLSVLVAAWAAYNVVNGVILLFQTKAWSMLSYSLVDFTSLRDLMSEILPVLVMVLATHLYVRIDVIMLDYFTTRGAVARYSAGYLFLDQLMILSNLMMSALFPNFARACVAKGAEFQVLYRGILLLFLKYLLPLAAIIACFSPVLLSTIFGAEYSAGWTSLSVLMGAAVLAWINGPSGTVFISLKKQHIYMYATLLSLAVNVVGNLILIPMMGEVGAAISTVFTEAAICAYCLWWIYRETGYLPWWRPGEVKSV